MNELAKFPIYFLITCILVFILYLGGKGLSRGIDAKARLKKKISIKKEPKISDELKKLSKLRSREIITDEEFEKAKKKLLK
tara:strand:+ start:53 stop:295 length:243 start_codon:yes stop_codon:yes gene_type:complete